MQLGYTMMTEQAGPKDLVSHVVGAEEVGFDFAVSSDHYFPWLDEMGHSPHAWTVLGAAAQATSRIPLMTYVTCPSFRYHPAVVAQQAATLQILSDGRFTLGLGAGENLNEHVVGAGWPPADVRQEMLVEAVQIIRELFDGDGTRTSAASTSTSSRPSSGTSRRSGCRSGSPSPGKQSCEIAGELADVMIAVEPKAELGRAVRRRRRRRQAADRPDADQLRHRQGRRRHPRAHAVPLVRPRLEGQRRAARPAGVRRGEPVRPRGGRRRGASRAGTTSTPSSRPRRSTPTPGFTHLALVQIGGDQQEPFLEWSREDADARPGGRPSAD